MSNRLDHFLGDTPARVALKLAIISLVVGVIMSALNLNPFDIWQLIKDFFEGLYNLGFEAFWSLGRYVFWGAMIVVPVFLLMRIFRARG